MKSMLGALLFVLISMLYATPVGAKPIATALPHYCPKPLTLGYFGDWYPYIFAHEGKILGSDWELLKQILDQLGCKVTVELMPEKRAHQVLMKQYALVMIAATITEERREYAYFSDEYRDEKMSFFYLADNKTQAQQSKSIGQLVADTDLIVINGAAWYGNQIESLRQRYKTNKFLHVHSLKRRIDMITKGRAQAFVEDHIAGCDFFHQLAPEQAPRLQAKYVNKTRVAYIFSRQAVTPNFIKRFNAVLAKRIKAGTYRKLSELYTPTACLESNE